MRKGREHQKKHSNRQKNFFQVAIVGVEHFGDLIPRISPEVKVLQSGILMVTSILIS